MIEPRIGPRPPPRLNGKPIPGSRVRVAIYTRKSTTEGLDQDLNSLDAQRQTAEAYIESQRVHGWVALPERYDDGGFTGANTDRPSFQRLLADIGSGRIDCVAVYKIDRLSRSLSDFARIMDLFERHAVTFVSVTQQFSTATSVGKLTLNLLMSFAEFERDVISERTRDKISACRRKGFWTGGWPVLGYDIREKKLAVNEEETRTVRAIFTAYLQSGTLLSTVRELESRSIRNKSFRSAMGRVCGGGLFTKTSLHALLTNPLYIGKIRAGGGCVDAVHRAVVDRSTWDAVQEQLRQNGRCPRLAPRKRWSSLLDGLLYCGTCGSAMGHQYTTKGSRRYSYYVCQTQQKRGASGCPGSRVAASMIDAHVTRQILLLGRDSNLHLEIPEAGRLFGELRASENLRPRAPASGVGGAGADRVPSIPPASFESGWDELLSREGDRRIRSLIEKVLYSASTDEVEIQVRAVPLPPNGDA